MNGHRHDDEHCGSERHDGGEGAGGGQRRDTGAAGTEFLDLEISQALGAEAERIARKALRELLEDAAEKRLKERLGPKLEALARLAADALADDLEANLAIEEVITRHGEARKDRAERAREAMRGAASDKGAARRGRK
ncbi:MAG: hypothetical protein AABZ30_11865 [Myxococcota bacterium]